MRSWKLDWSLRIRLLRRWSGRGSLGIVLGEVGSGVRLEEGWVMVVWAEALNPRVRVEVEQSIGCEYKGRLHTILGGFEGLAVMW